MTKLLDPTSHPYWRVNFGKRYMGVSDFRNFCSAVGLHACTEGELQECERQDWLLPAARLIMPEAYAQAYDEAELGGLAEFKIDEALVPLRDLHRAIKFPAFWPDTGPDDDLRHPIDKAWGSVPELVRPRDEGFRPWDSYQVELQSDDIPVLRNLAEHFYHHWQIYELYQVRRSEKSMYRQDLVLPGLLGMVNRSRGDYLGLARGLEAVSQFQYLHSRQRQQYVAPIKPDEDLEIVLTDTQLAELKELLRGHAQVVCQHLTVEEEQLYYFLKELMRLHHGYERSERVKLARTLKYDIWRTVELIEALTGSSTEDIAEKAGSAGAFRGPYLAVLFPNRRKEVREKSLRILKGLADQEYNRSASNYAVEEQDFETLITFLEHTDLALFGYAIVEVNEAFFARHSWRTTASYLALKSLASLPESLTKTVILHSHDNQVISGDHELRSTNLYDVACLLFSSREGAIWAAYERLHEYRRAADKAQFSNHLAHLATVIKDSQNAEQYLGANMALATLLRNFTSHHLLEDRELLQGQYLRSVRAIIATILLVWKTTQKHSLL